MSRKDINIIAIIAFTILILNISDNKNDVFNSKVIKMILFLRTLTYIVVFITASCVSEPEGNSSRVVRDDFGMGADENNEFEKARNSRDIARDQTDSSPDSSPIPNEGPVDEPLNSFPDDNVDPVGGLDDPSVDPVDGVGVTPPVMVTGAYLVSCDYMELNQITCFSDSEVNTAEEQESFVSQLVLENQSTTEMQEGLDYSIEVDPSDKKSVVIDLHTVSEENPVTLSYDSSEEGEGVEIVVSSSEDYSYSFKPAGSKFYFNIIYDRLVTIDQIKLRDNDQSIYMCKIRPLLSNTVGEWGSFTSRITSFEYQDGVITYNPQIESDLSYGYQLVCKVFDHKIMNLSYEDIIEVSTK